MDMRTQRDSLLQLAAQRRMRRRRFAVLLAWRAEARRALLTTEASDRHAQVRDRPSVRVTTAKSCLSPSD